MTLPTRDQMKAVFASARPVRDKNAIVALPTADLASLGLCVYDLLELPASVFDGVDGDKCEFMQSGLRSWLGMGKGAERV
jgi:hypothetical protein